LEKKNSSITSKNTKFRFIVQIYPSKEVSFTFDEFPNQECK